MSADVLHSAGRWFPVTLHDTTDCIVNPGTIRIQLGVDNTVLYSQIQDGTSLQTL